MNDSFAVIGLGKVGKAFLEKLTGTGYVAAWVLSSQPSGFDLPVHASLPAEPGTARIVFLAVPDSAIASTAAAIAAAWGPACSGLCFFHFSGLLPAAVLRPLAEQGAHIASLHPLQTVVDFKPTDFTGCVFAFEGAPQAEDQARQIAGALGGSFVKLAAADKPLYHCGAAMASNYLITLLAQAEQVLAQSGIGREGFLPLVETTLANFARQGGRALTGPVQRGDWTTVAGHLEALAQDFADLLPFYKNLGQATARLAGRVWPAELGSRVKVAGWDAVAADIAKLQRRGHKVVFTNGCFDLLHAGHVEYLERARALGDCLVVGLNSDASVRHLNKGPERPLNSELARAQVLAGLGCVDYVTVFDQDTPYELIKRLEPDVLVKGGDWQVADIVGSDIVQAKGGQVLSIEFKDGFSTTSIVEKIKLQG